MGSIFFVLVLLFGCMFLVGIFSPKAGLFYIPLKKKTRMLSIMFNLGLSIIFLIIGSAITPVDYYESGQSELQKNNYQSAIANFLKIKSGSKNFDRKASLIEETKSKALAEFTPKIESYAKSLNIHAAESLFTILSTIIGDQPFSKDSITVWSSSAIANIRIQITKAEQENDFSSIIQKAGILQQIPSEKEWATNLIDKFTMLAQKAEVDNLKKSFNTTLKLEHYDSARALLSKLSNYNSETEYVDKMTKKIADLYSAKTERDYKKNAAQVAYRSYASIMRQPDDFKGSRVSIKAKVFQKFEGGYLVNCLMCGDDDKLFLRYFDSSLLEDDILDFWGDLVGTSSYTTVLGVEITVPVVEVRYATCIFCR